MVRQRILSATTFIWTIFLSFASLKEKGAIFCCLPEEAHYRITHYRPRKTVRFSISVLKTKGLAGLYSNPKYQAVWFVLCKMRPKTLILSLFQALKTAKDELLCSILTLFLQRSHRLSSGRSQMIELSLGYKTMVFD